MVSDPGGAVIGGWQPGTHQGFGVHGEPGTPSWFELHTRDYGASVDFYRKVFAWDTHVASDTPDLRYTTLGEGETARWPASWTPTAFLPEGSGALVGLLGTADADTTLAKIVEIGGSIVEPATDTPYGWLAPAADPTGASSSSCSSRLPQAEADCPGRGPPHAAMTVSV